MWLNLFIVRIFLLHKLNSTNTKLVYPNYVDQNSVYDHTQGFASKFIVEKEKPTRSKNIPVILAMDRLMGGSMYATSNT